MHTGTVLRAVVGVAASLALMLTVTAMPAAAGRGYECQHPATTGEGAGDLHHISPATACAVVRKLAAFENAPATAGRLYRCRMPAPGDAGVPVLKLHRFDGYHLKIVQVVALDLSRGPSSFSVGGTDFPFHCE